MTADLDDDRELWAVLVALEPLDGRKWRYLNLERRTFDSDAMLDQPWSSGERALVEVAASLWNEGKVDLGYIACALGDRHLQAVIDAVAIRAGRPLMSASRHALDRVLQSDRHDDRGLDRQLEHHPRPAGTGLGREL
jgi:hypothetical protein